VVGIIIQQVKSAYGKLSVFFFWLKLFMLIHKFLNIYQTANATMPIIIFLKKEWDDFNMLKEKSCGAIVYRIGNEKGEPQILLIKHKNGEHWSFPKGHTEFGESEHETALREVKEETGLDVVLQPGFRRTVIYRPKPNTEKEVVYFVAEVKEGEINIQEEELSEAMWVGISRASILVTFENDRRLISGAKQFLVDAPAFSAKKGRSGKQT
jgi:8-oxo-dGTP pyrophosphatase MutT (NUDIX family)